MLFQQATHNKMLEKMIIEKENLVTSINDYHNTIDAMVSEISSIAESALGLQEQMADLELDESLMQSRKSHALSLYSKVSNISWDYTAPPGVLAGGMVLAALTCLPLLHNVQLWICILMISLISSLLIYIHIYLLPSVLIFCYIILSMGCLHS